jgi:hypothetical protein
VEAVFEWYDMIHVANLTMSNACLGVNKEIARNSDAVDLLLSVSKRHSRDTVVVEQAKGALLLLQPQRYNSFVTR